MVDVNEVVHVWSRAGHGTLDDRLGLYAQALTADRPVGPYRALEDAQSREGGPCDGVGARRGDRP